MFTVTIDNALTVTLKSDDYGKAVKTAFRLYSSLEEAEGEHTIVVYDNFLGKELINWNTARRIIYTT